MNSRKLLIFCLVWFLGALSDAETRKSCELKHKSGNKKFPNDFAFGVSTAAYQIEGGWNEDGKSLSIWDTFTHEHSEMIDDHSTGDVAADSYHRFDQDLAALKRLKVNFYRFSISWSRILPTGELDSLNNKGVDYYNMVINKLLENGIEPMVTMFHYDLPERLSALGGFANPLLIGYFHIYAIILFKLFGDRVKVWITFNEPFDYCIPGYGKAEYPPMINGSGVIDYICMDTTLKAHGAAYRIYRKKFYEKQKGKVGITISSRYYFNYNKNNESGEDLIQKAMDYSLGFLATPIYGSYGNYPIEMINHIKESRKSEKRFTARLKNLTEYWSEIVHGSADFLGLNYYTSRYVVLADPPLGPKPSWENDSGLKYRVDPKWRKAKSSWLYCIPEGLEGLLNYIRKTYNNIEVMITENGWSDDGQLDDNERIDYLKAHLQAVLNAVNNGCNVTRYTHWSLIDNFEWRKGYTEKFGLYYVNMTSAEKERIPKKSSRYYRKVIDTKMIPENI